MKYRECLTCPFEDYNYCSKLHTDPATCLIAEEPEPAPAETLRLIELRAAFRTLADQNPNQNPTREERAAWTALETACIDAGLCPSCFCDGETTELMEWEPGDYWSNAGRECPDCEEFYPCGNQPSYEYGPDCTSDAVSGF